LGQVRNPTEAEASMLLPVLDDPRHRGRALLAVAGSAGWFERLRPRLSDLMRGDDATAWAVTPVLRKAMAFDRDRTLADVEEHWLDPPRPSHVYAVLHQLDVWDERAVAAAKTIAASLPPLMVNSLVKDVSRCAPEAAPRILLAKLQAELDLARRMREPDPEPAATSTGNGDHGAQLCHHVRRDASRFGHFRRVLDGGHS
jgi:hypothetical protein